MISQDDGTIKAEFLQALDPDLWSSGRGVQGDENASSHSPLVSPDA